MSSGCFAAGYSIGVPYSLLQSDFFSERVPNPFVTATWLMPHASLLPRSGSSEVERTQMMNRLGVPLDGVAAMTDAMAALVDSGDYIFPVFTSLDAALAFKSAFLDTLDVRVLGLGLPAELVTGYLARWLDQSEQSGDRWFGTLACLRKRQPLVPGGADLGFELLGEDYPGLFHSWLFDGGLEAEIHQRFGVEINQFGLIDDQGLATESAELIEREEWADQVSWHPWLLVSY